MARERGKGDAYTGPLRRLLLGVLVVALLGVFLLWRIDSPRVERFRAQIVDKVVPNFDWAMAPVTATVSLFRDFQSYQRLHQQNRDLRQELQQMKAWQEAAQQLEQQNARLRDLNNVRLDPRLTYVTGVVLADSGSPFRHSVLINIGAQDGVVDGWAAMDGLGLVGRVSGVGGSTARVILLSDAASRIPVTIEQTGQRALVIGDNTGHPQLDFVENRAEVRPGDRVTTSGDGGVFPAGLLVGRVLQDPGGRLRVRLAADYDRLEFLRVLRTYQKQSITEPGDLITPPGTPDAPLADGAELPAAEATEPAEPDNG